jgi:predicted negative regulator of RcsB-dependent stress response
MGFSKLVKLTNGINGNKLYNKLARVSAARLLFANTNYDEALIMIEKYSSSSTNAYIHELTGDILMKKDSISLAKEQYQIAKEKYIDEASLSIISMKLANIDS